MRTHNIALNVTWEPRGKTPLDRFTVEQALLISNLELDVYMQTTQPRTPWTPGSVRTRSAPRAGPASLGLHLAARLSSLEGLELTRAWSACRCPLPRSSRTPGSTRTMRIGWRRSRERFRSGVTCTRWTAKSRERWMFLFPGCVVPGTGKVQPRGARGSQGSPFRFPAFQ